jgi:farnesyl diphosphate synthase
VETRLAQLLESNSSRAPRLMQAMRYAALGPGKRIRPFFVLTTAKLLGADPTHALNAAAALECVHAYSLVHDDLPAMDDDDLRRGRPTTHKAFDEATAILAGDGLLTLAFEILANPTTHPNPTIRANLVLELARASGVEGMAGGQMRDIEAETQSGLTLDDIIALQSMKTGALFRFALDAAAILAAADAPTRKSLRTYADAVGLAFQLADDLLDHESTPQALGKRTGKDAAAGKATFVELLGLEGAKAHANTLVETAVDALAPFGDKAETLRQAARFIITRKS